MADKEAARLEALNAKVQRAALRGAWQRERGTRPQEEIRPALWRWNDMAALLLEAGALVPIDDVMKMRTLHMSNSSDPIPLGAARTFAAMLQQVNGGEITESHRHTATSVYFMIQGSGIYTTAEGRAAIYGTRGFVNTAGVDLAWFDEYGKGTGRMVYRDGHQSYAVFGYMVRRKISGGTFSAGDEARWLSYETLGRIADQRCARWSRSVSDQVLLARYDGGSRRDRSSWRDRPL